MFISPAFASASSTAATGAATGGSFLASLLPLFLVVVIFYLFLVRPQQKRMADYQKLVSGLRKGDRIVTSGGIIGTIHRVEANATDVTVEIAKDVHVRVQRNAIAEVLAKTGSVEDNSEKKSA